MCNDCIARLRLKVGSMVPVRAPYGDKKQRNKARVRGLVNLA